MKKNPAENSLIYNAHQAQECLNFLDTVFPDLKRRYSELLVSHFRMNKMDFTPIVAKLTVMQDIEDHLKSMVRQGDKENKKEQLNDRDITE